jgi:aminoglycoside phosphotransferase (APT) family kinase protein
VPSAADRVRSRLALYLSGRFARKAEVQVSGLADITSGWESEVFSFDLDYVANGQAEHESLILRLYPGSSAAEKARREFLFLQHLHGSGYPVPRPVLLEADGSPFGRPLLVMERVEGRPLGEIIDEAPEPRKQELLALFCRLLAQLHALDWRSFVSDPALHRPETVLEEKLAATRQELARFGRSEFAAVLAWLQRQCAAVQPRRLAVTHGDFHPANVLLRQDGSAVVIDWGGAGICDYRTDLAWTLLLVSTYEGPAMRERVLSLYEELTGCRVEQIDCFEVWAMLRRLFAVSVSASGEAATLGIRPAALDKVRQDVDNVRRVYGLLVARTGLVIPEVEELIASLETPPV